ncbi:unnamed protein product [Parascedosporium putredinis]|uniref:FAD-binding PCMH-type domain-containing protein n=1 Tax=Parascedosporium putredinis TaxID=1442378 RepID=A0A9P1GYJ3_9PEZI|nr:unnamed protein product [Parascedosporium putredinis]CAI7990805.1 unnamed protein product [Parascedosporium putredinis]
MSAAKPSTEASALPILYRDTTEASAFHDAVWGRVFNERRDTSRSPKAVVLASSASHIKAAVQLANEQGCRVSVRSGGHSWAAWSVRQEAILIDLGNYQGVWYDEKTHVVSCTPSSTGRIVNGFLKEKGRMFAGGHCPDVGLGVSSCRAVWAGIARYEQLAACENWGWACENIASIEVVTADGEELTCSETENSDLFWAARGSGPGLPTADPDMEIVCVSKCNQDTGAIEIVAGFTVFKQTKEEAEAALRPIHDGRPADPAVDNAYVANDEDVPSVLEAAFTTLPSKKAFALYFSMNPTSRRPLPDMALSMQSDHYFALYTVWEDAADDERCTAWVYDVMRDVERRSVGSYLGDADFRHRRTKYWSDAHGKKLMDVRRKWDPRGTVCGYLDVGDQSGVEGLKNEFEWS